MITAPKPLFSKRFQRYHRYHDREAKHVNPVKMPQYNPQHKQYQCTIHGVSHKTVRACHNEFGIVSYLWNDIKISYSIVCKNPKSHDGSDKQTNPPK